jgi:hypothetical protein
LALVMTANASAALSMTASPAGTTTSDTTPTFSGATEDLLDPVSVQIYTGASAEGTPARTLTTATPLASSEWSLTVAEPLSEDEYTALAEQIELGGMKARSTAGPVTFVIHTKPPSVSLAAPPDPSNDRTPAFSGTASEAGTVTVRVFAGEHEYTKVTATASNGTWSAPPLPTALPEGEHTFTAVAYEPSSVPGDGEGESHRVSFTVDSNPPELSLAPVTTPSRETKPSFSGTDGGAGSATKPIVVHVFEGPKPEGKEVAKVTTAGSQGAWSSPAVALERGTHTFTAVATQESPVGNAPGKSPPVVFFVNTEPPVVTVKPIAEVSSNTHPSFSGTVSEAGMVTVRIYSGPAATGTPVSTLTTAASEGRWVSSPVFTALKEGEYTAVASEPSGLGNGPGSSGPISFTVSLRAPTVVVTPPPQRSRETRPSFSGTVSEAGEVIVEVFEGDSAAGRLVQAATVKAGGHSWSAGPVALAPHGRHTYTAVATDRTAIGTGTSAPVTFEVDTEPPAVTLDQPPALSNHTTPSFSGTSDEPSPLTVAIYAGPKAEGTPVASAAASVALGGSWNSENAAPPLADGTYTAVAFQKSAIGNEEGRSAPVSFAVDTAPPTVTLKPLPSPSSIRTPSFSGTASDHEPVTVTVYPGPRAQGTPAATLVAEAGGGNWVSPKAEPLAWGQYTAVAAQPSSLGNPSGVSEAVTFTVAQIPPLVVAEPPSSIKRSSAVFYASVDPNGGSVAQSGCQFEYGTTTAYGQSVGCASVSGAFPLTGAASQVFARANELSPSTSYHFRIVASDEGGVAYGPDETLTTAAAVAFDEGGALPESAAPVAAGSHAVSGVASFFASQLAPPRRGTLAWLLRWGTYGMRLRSPGPGTAVVNWFYLPPGASLTRKSKHHPVLIAAGKRTFAAAQTLTIKLHLTSEGRRLLKRVTRIRLTATCTFTPVGHAPGGGLTTFELKR